MAKKIEPATIGFCGDVHCGSVVGLWPVDDLPAKKFVGIRYLMDCYEDMVRWMPPLDLLVLTGDLIDGKQYKSSGVGVLTTDVGEQADAAAKVLKKLASKAKRIYRVWGTPYHETHDAVLKIVDEALKVHLTQQVINLELPTGILNLAHHPAGGASIYQGTVVDREALWSEIAAYEGKVPDPRFIIRGHKHTYFLQETATRTICLLPCWQLPTAWAVKQNLWRFQPSLGAVLMKSDSEHPSGYKFLPKLYPMPTEEVQQW